MSNKELEAYSKRCELNVQALIFLDLYSEESMRKCENNPDIDKTVYYGYEFRQQIIRDAGPIFQEYLEKLKIVTTDCKSQESLKMTLEEINQIDRCFINTHRDSKPTWLNDLIKHRLIPDGFDWSQKHYWEGGDDPAVFTAIRHGYIPEGFYQWHLENSKHKCIAHLAALNGLLPATFKDWNLTDYNGYTVSDVIRFNLFEKIYIRNN